MILLLNGPLGVGKSRTGEALLARLPRGALVDGDHAAAVTPFDIHDRRDLDYAAQALFHLAHFHHSHGYRPLIVAYVLETPRDLGYLTGLLAALGEPILAFRLRATPETLAARIRARGRPEVAWELERGPALHTILDRNGRDGALGTVVETTGRSPAQVATTILRAAALVPE